MSLALVAYYKQLKSRPEPDLEVCSTAAAKIMIRGTNFLGGVVVADEFGVLICFDAGRQVQGARCRVQG